MDDKFKDYISTPNDKRRRTQQTPSENSVTSTSVCQSACTSDLPVSHSDTLSTAGSSGVCNSSSINFSNGCDTKRKTNGHSSSSNFDKTRAALYRNIYNSSSSDDEDEHCVYTYKGAEDGSDLPESFVHLGMNGQNREGASARSSPEMDFLEMDFDPGSSNGQDSDSDNVTSQQNHNNSWSATEDTGRVRENESDASQLDENANCCSNKVLLDMDNTIEESLDHNSIAPVQESENPCCSKSLPLNDNDTDRTEYTIKPSTVSSQNYSDLSSDEEPFTNNSASNYFNCDPNNEFEVDENLHHQKSSDDSDKEDSTFIFNGFNPDKLKKNCDTNLMEKLWDIEVQKNVNNFISYDDLLPLDPSYSISAVINVMKILSDFQCEIDNREKLINLLQMKQISESASLVEYLFMRSVENANEADLANFVSELSDNKVHSRFFSTHPNADFNLMEWLYTWMRKGAVPVVTRNIQERGSVSTRSIIRNPWRHNVVHKLESPYIHVSNPNEEVLDCVLYSQLCQPSLIYVKKECILRMWHSKVDLRLLTRANHNRWYNENVLGQVVTMIRESDRDNNTMKYVRIPSNCHCGITLFAPTENSTLCREVDEAVDISTAICC